MRIFLILLGIATAFCLLHLRFHTDSLRQPAIISHRGAGGLAPENTLAGIQAALDHQVRLVEVDLRRSQDGVLLLLHDRTVDRTTNGQGAAHALPWSTLQTLDAGRHFAAEFAGTPLPALEAVFAFVQNKPLTLVIELKDTALYPGIEQALANAIKQHHLEKQIIVISFQPASLQTLHQILPEVAQGRLALYPTNLAFTAAKRQARLDSSASIGRVPF